MPKLLLLQGDRELNKLDASILELKFPSRLTEKYSTIPVLRAYKLDMLLQLNLHFRFVQSDLGWFNS